jgi:hypothetical protein
MGTRKEMKGKISVVGIRNQRKYGEFKWLKCQDKMRKERKLPKTMTKSIIHVM